MNFKRQNRNLLFVIILISAITIVPVKRVEAIGITGAIGAAILIHLAVFAVIDWVNSEDPAKPPQKALVITLANSEEDQGRSSIQADPGGGGAGAMMAMQIMLEPVTAEQQENNNTEPYEMDELIYGQDQSMSRSKAIEHGQEHVQNINDGLNESQGYARYGNPTYFSTSSTSNQGNDYDIIKYKYWVDNCPIGYCQYSGYAYRDVWYLVTGETVVDCAPNTSIDIDGNCRLEDYKEDSVLRVGVDESGNFIDGMDPEQDNHTTVANNQVATTIHDKRYGDGTLNVKRNADGTYEVTQSFSQVPAQKYNGAATTASITTTKKIDLAGTVLEETVDGQYADGSAIQENDNIGGAWMNETGTSPVNGSGPCQPGEVVNSDGTCGGNCSTGDIPGPDGTCIVICNIGEYCEGECPEGSPQGADGVCKNTCPAGTTVAGETCGCDNTALVFKETSYTCECEEEGFIFETDPEINACIGPAPMAWAASPANGSFLDISDRLNAARTQYSTAKEQFNLTVSHSFSFNAPTASASLPCLGPWTILDRTYDVCRAMIESGVWR